MRMINFGRYLSAWLAKPLVAFFGLYMVSSAAQAPLDVRVALVVGNAAYAGALALKNPTNDATAMAAALKDLGFTVIEARDASRAQMEDGVKQLFASLKGKQGVGLLYYAGHGLQVDMRNYMVPVDARLQSAKDVPGQTLDVADVLDAMKAAGTRMNIVVLDACRNNPFKDKSGNGLAPVDAPAGTLLAYATAPGNVAEDGTGSNGLYTKHLLAELQKPVGIENVFKRVRLNVRQESRGRQIPWESTSLEDDFYFKRDAAAVKPSPAQRNNDYVEQKAAWDKIKDSKNADDFYAFLAAFPSGMLSEIALFKLERLAATPLTVQPPAGEKPQTQMADRLKVGDEWTTEESDSMSMFGGKDTHVYKVVSQEGDLLAVKRGAMATFYYTPSGAYAGLDQPLVPKVM